MSGAEPRAQCSGYGPAYFQELRMAGPQAMKDRPKPASVSISPFSPQEFLPQSPWPCPSSSCLHTSDDSKLTTTQSSLCICNPNQNPPPWTELCSEAAGPHCRPGFGGQTSGPSEISGQVLPPSLSFPARRSQSSRPSASWFVCTECPWRAPGWTTDWLGS